MRELDRLKLYRARSRLYRSKILQENMRLKALAEIYTMHSFASLKSHFFDKIENSSNKEKEKCDFRAVQRSASCRSRRELSNAYFHAKFASIQPRTSPVKFARSSRGAGKGGRPGARPGAEDRSPSGAYDRRRRGGVGGMFWSEKCFFRREKEETGKSANLCKPL